MIAPMSTAFVVEAAARPRARDLRRCIVMERYFCEKRREGLEEFVVELSVVSSGGM